MAEKAKTAKGKKKPKVKAGTSKAAAAAKKASFVEAYIVNGGNATQAAVAAGYSEKTAYSQGPRLLKDVEVQAAIQARQAELADKHELTTDSVLRALSRIVHSDPRKFYRPDGSLKNVTELDDDAALSLAGVEVVEMAGGMQIDAESGPSHVPMYTKKVKFWDKNAAIEKAMKHLGMFEKDNEQQKTPAVINIQF